MELVRRWQQWQGKRVGCVTQQVAHDHEYRRIGHRGRPYRSLRWGLKAEARSPSPIAMVPFSATNDLHFLEMAPILCCRSTLGKHDRRTHAIRYASIRRLPQIDIVY